MRRRLLNTEYGMKLISCFTLVCFIYSFIIHQSVMAMTTLIEETKVVSRLERSGEQLLLPAHLGRVSGGHDADSRRLVVYVQDLHCNAEVQRNIAGILSYFEKNRGINRIYVEGAPAGKLDIGLLGSIPDDDIRDKTIEGLVSRGLLSGSEYYALKFKQDKLYGLEEWGIYRDNLDRYRRLSERREVNRKVMMRLMSKVDALKEKYFDRKLKRIEKVFTGGQKDARYARMEKLGGRVGHLMSGYPNLARYTAVIKLNQEIRYKRLNTELGLLVKELQRAVPMNEYLSLTTHMNDTDSRDAFYRQLSALARTYCFDMRRKYPNAALFFASMELHSQINPIQFIAEENLFKSRVLAAYAQRKMDRDLLLLSRMSADAGDYVGLSMTPDQCRRFTADRESFLALLRKYFDRADIRDALAILTDETYPQFYAANLERNRVFMDVISRSRDTGSQESASTLRKGKTAHSVPSGHSSDSPGSVLNRIGQFETVDVVVAGGFHMDVAKYLKNSNVSSLTITPSMTRDHDASIYEQVITGRIDFRKFASSALAPMADSLGIDQGIIIAMIEQMMQVSLGKGLTPAQCAVVFNQWQEKEPKLNAIVLTPKDNRMDIAVKKDGAEHFVLALVIQGQDIKEVIRAGGDSGASPVRIEKGAVGETVTAFVRDIMTKLFPSAQKAALPAVEDAAQELTHLLDYPDYNNFNRSIDLEVVRVVNTLAEIAARPGVSQNTISRIIDAVLLLRSHPNQYISLLTDVIVKVIEIKGVKDNDIRRCIDVLASLFATKDQGLSNYVLSALQSMVASERMNPVLIADVCEQLKIPLNQDGWDLHAILPQYAEIVKSALVQRELPREARAKVYELLRSMLEYKVRYVRLHGSSLCHQIVAKMKEDSATVSEMMSLAGDVMGNQNPDIRRDGVILVGKFASSTIGDEQVMSSIMSLLRRAARDDDRDVKYEALRILSTVASQYGTSKQLRSDIIRMFQQASSDPDELIRSGVVAFAGGIASRKDLTDDDKNTILLICLNALSDASSRVRESAIASAGMLLFSSKSYAQHSGEIRAGLKKMARDEDSSVRYKALKILGSSDDMIDILREAMRDPVESIRELAIDNISENAKGKSIEYSLSKGILLSLKEALPDSSSVVAGKAAGALVLIERAAKNLLEALYPQHKELIDELSMYIPHFETLNTAGFIDSLLLTEQGLINIVYEYRRLYEQIGNNLIDFTNSFTRISDIALPLYHVNPHAGIQQYGYFLPHPLYEGDQWEAPQPRRKFSVKNVASLDDVTRRILINKWEQYLRLVAFNSSALEVVKEGRTKRQFMKALTLVGEMIESLAGIDEQAAAPARAALSRVTDDLQKQWADKDDAEELPPSVVKRIRQAEQAKNMQDIGTLHSLIIAVHQLSAETLLKAYAKAKATTKILDDNVEVLVTDLSDNDAPAYDAERGLPNMTLEAILRIFDAAHPAGWSDTVDSIIVRGNMLTWTSKIGAHRIDLLANLNALDDGGFIQIIYFEDANDEENILRATYFKTVLDGLGFTSSLDDTDSVTNKKKTLITLNAVYGKDSGGTHTREITDILPMAMRVFLGSTNFDKALESYHLKAGKPGSMMAVGREVGKVFLSEGSLPFYNANPASFPGAYAKYLREIPPQGIQVRARLNELLGGYGFPLIPENVSFGQRIIDLYYTVPVNAALARGELVFGDDGIPRKNPGYNPLKAVLMKIEGNEQDALRTAMIVTMLGEDQLDMKPVGFAGGLVAEAGQMLLINGDWIVVTALKDPGTGRIVYASAQESKFNGGIAAISADTLRDRLADDGNEIWPAEHAAAPVRDSMRRLLMKTIAADGPGRRVFHGISSSPGATRDSVGGALTFRSYTDTTGKILIKPFTTPDDLDAIQSARAVVVTHGTQLSHAGITTREFGIPSVIIPEGQWHENGVHVVSYEPGAVELVGDIQISRTVIEETFVLQEGDIVLVNGAEGTISLFNRESQALLREANALLDGILAGKNSPETMQEWLSLKSQSPDVSHAALADTAEYMAVVALANDGLRHSVKEWECPIEEVNNRIMTVREFRKERKYTVADIHARDERAVMKPRGRIAKRQRKAIERSERLVYSLGELDAQYAGVAGPKAANLGEILKVVKAEGASVPEGISIATKAFDLFLGESGIRVEFEHLTGELDAILSKEQSSDDTQRIVKQYSDRIRALISKATIPAESGVGAAILQALEDYGMMTDGDRYAVRSSAVAEDTARAAFAGAAETYLEVPRDELLERVKECWMSFYLPRGIGYRAALGGLQTNVLPAVLVQRMVNADVAGIIFSKDPSTGANETIINASYGLGESVVHGSVQADTYRSRPEDGAETDFPVIGSKRFKIVRDQNGSGTMNAVVSKAERQRRCLDANTVRKLTKIASVLEQHFGYPVDIEFAIASDVIYILQVRPVTTSKQSASEEALSPAEGVPAITPSMDIQSMARILTGQLLTPSALPAMPRHIFKSIVILIEGLFGSMGWFGKYVRENPALLGQKSVVIYDPQWEGAVTPELSYMLEHNMNPVVVTGQKGPGRPAGDFIGRLTAGARTINVYKQDIGVVVLTLAPAREYTTIDTAALSSEDWSLALSDLFRELDGGIIGESVQRPWLAFLSGLVVPDPDQMPIVFAQDQFPASKGHEEQQRYFEQLIETYKDKVSPSSMKTRAFRTGAGVTMGQAGLMVQTKVSNNMDPSGQHNGDIVSSVVSFARTLEKRNIVKIGLDAVIAVTDKGNIKFKDIDAAQFDEICSQLIENVHGDMEVILPLSLPAGLPSDIFAADLAAFLKAHPRVGIRMSFEGSNDMQKTIDVIGTALFRAKISPKTTIIIDCNDSKQAEFITRANTIYGLKLTPLGARNEAVEIKVKHDANQTADEFKAALNARHANLIVVTIDSIPLMGNTEALNFGDILTVLSMYFAARQPFTADEARNKGREAAVSAIDEMGVVTTGDVANIVSLLISCYKNADKGIIPLQKLSDSLAGLHKELSASTYDVLQKKIEYLIQSCSRKSTLESDVNTIYGEISAGFITELLGEMLLRVMPGNDTFDRQKMEENGQIEVLKKGLVALAMTEEQDDPLVLLVGKRLGTASKHMSLSASELKARILEHPSPVIRYYALQTILSLPGMGSDRDKKDIKTAMDAAAKELVLLPLSDPVDTAAAVRALAAAFKASQDGQSVPANDVIAGTRNQIGMLMNRGMLPSESLALLMLMTTDLLKSDSLADRGEAAIRIAQPALREITMLLSAA